MIKFFKENKYTFIMLFMLFGFLLYFLYYYPGIIISDTYSQMNQALGESSLRNHHPIFQTFIWWIFIKIGKLFNQDNVIVAFNSIFQMISMAAVFTYTIYILDKKKIKNTFLIFIYALYPMFRNL